MNLWKIGSFLCRLFQYFLKRIGPPKPRENEVWAWQRKISNGSIELKCILKRFEKSRRVDNIFRSKVRFLSRSCALQSTTKRNSKEKNLFISTKNYIPFKPDVLSKMIEKMQFHQKGQQKCINFSFLLQNWKMSRIYKIAILGAKIQSSIKFIKENKSYLISYQFVTNTQKYKKNSSNHYKITCWNKLNKLDRRFSLLPLQLGILGLTEDLTPAPPKNSSSSTLLAHRRRKQQRVLKSSV